MPELTQVLRRRVQGAIEEDLDARKMVFLAGPRQCGKTTVARQLLDQRGGSYFNIDAAEHRKALREGMLPETSRLWVFDELHKQRQWRGWLKGVFDLHGREHELLVTGSGRLDLFRRGGDSLQGRYHLHRLHPLTLSEVLGLPGPTQPADVLELGPSPSAVVVKALDDLMTLGGFPEPLLGGSERRAARWRLAYGTRLIREDVRDLEAIRDLERLELLFDRLPDLVGSTLSINALREDLEVSFDTVKSWIAALERLYGAYRIAPLGPPRIRAVRKEQKLYLWDWARVPGEAARFENLVMAHLVRLVDWLTDVHGEKAELRYFRDVTGREVDAIVLRGGKPWFAVEVKLAAQELDPGLRYLLERYRVPRALQVSLRGGVERRMPDINGARVELVSAARFLAALP
jgi:predicted AAA+ superfamily ATPase